MTCIQTLPPNVVNKIAAGEVIERPASVVKELMENAVDAGASRIDVVIADGGRESIRVHDNGCGLAAGELPLAVASHATSKLRSADDLFRVATLGFRGEALASIAEVSHFIIASRPATSEAGARLEVLGGRSRSAEPWGGPPGTTVEVRNLFFNTPVRRKFLRTVQTESSHASEAFTRIALAYPRVHFTLAHNDKKLFDLAPTDAWRQRIASFFGTDLAEDLIDVKGGDDGIELDGYVANPAHSRSHNRLQYLFLNGRVIRDRSLQHALGEAYRGLLLTGRHPICFLRLRLAPEAVDVNVHPTKAEVRFQDAGRLYSHLLATVRTRFLTTDLAARFQRTTAAEARPPEAQRHVGQPPAMPAAAQHALAGLPSQSVSGPLAVVPPAGATLPAGGTAESRLAGPARPAGEAAEPEIGPAKAMQIHNRYLVVENDEGFVVFDQHALHERVLYEHLRAKLRAGNLQSQNLLVPEPVDLTPSEAAVILEHETLLRQLGLEIRPFGGGTVLVTAYPAMLEKAGPRSVVRGVADRLMSGGKAPDASQLTEQLLQMMSCKAAVKAGDPLTREEVDALLRQRHMARDSHHCPHGRPTALVFSRQDLDKQFKRS